MSDRGPSEELRARVLAAVRSEPAPRAHGRGAAAALAAGAVVVFVATTRPHAEARPVSVVLGTAGASAILAWLLTRAARGRMPSDRASMLPPGDRRAASVVGAAVVALALVALGASLGAPDLAALEASSLPLAAHVACGALVLLQGALPLLALLWPGRGTDPRSPAITGAALGAAAGTWAVMLAWLRCPHVSPAHGMLAHAAPVLVLSAAGALLGARLLRMR